MGLSHFQFAQSAWLWGLLAIPFVPLLYFLMYRAESTELLERFADRHLLVHLVKSRGVAGRNIRMPLLLWTLAWCCGVVAMAGPRWNYVDQKTFRVAEDLVIVLDLSSSMDANDVKPSRVGRAREEIEDLLDMSRGTSIGLVAYAAVPHMVTPLTDDVRTIKDLLPALDTSLVTIQGDRLNPAMEMAAHMLKAETGGNKSVLVISDGTFQEGDFASLIKAAGNATIYTMGIGTAAGGKGSDGKITRLQAGRLKSLAEAGHGLYVEANYTNDDTRAILGRIDAANNNAQATTKTTRLWQERFYIPALLLALLLLPLFRRGATLFAAVLLAMTIFPMGNARALTVADVFLNKAQQAKVAFDKGDYKTAIAKFDTPYRRGVAAYRAKDYDKASAYFRAAAAQKGDLDAMYDLGNSQLMQGLPEDAITSYETVLKQRPHDVPTLHNLAIARKMLQKNKQQPPKDKNNKSGQNNQGGGQKQKQQQGKGGGKNQKSDAQNKQASNQGNQAKKQAGQADPHDAKPQQGGKGQQAQGKGTPGQSSPQGEKQRAAAAQRAGNGNRQPDNKQGNSVRGYRLEKGRDRADNARPRTQLDVNADEWLNRVQNDPGSFLRNQFMIEDQASGTKKGER